MAAAAQSQSDLMMLTISIDDLDLMVVSGDKKAMCGQWFAKQLQLSIADFWAAYSYQLLPLPLRRLRWYGGHIMWLSVDIKRAVADGRIPERLRRMRTCSP